MLSHGDGRSTKAVSDLEPVPERVPPDFEAGKWFTQGMASQCAPTRDPSGYLLSGKEALRVHHGRTFFVSCWYVPATGLSPLPTARDNPSIARLRRDVGT